MPEIAAELIAKIKAAANSRACRSNRFSRVLRHVAQGASLIGKGAHASDRHRSFHRRPASTAVSVLANAGGFSGQHSGRAAHAGRFHGNVCQASGRNLRDRVKEAQSGDLLLAGRVLICPGNRHMKVKRMPLGNVVVLTRRAARQWPPSFGRRSVPQRRGRVRPQCIAVHHDRHGRRWRRGLGTSKHAGGMTIAQSEESCVVLWHAQGRDRAGLRDADRGISTMASTLQSLCVRLRQGRNAGRPWR